jgi:hypothetical protein
MVTKNPLGTALIDDLPPDEPRSGGYAPQGDYAPQGYSPQLQPARQKLPFITSFVSQHVLVLYVMAFVGFVIACSAMGKVNGLANRPTSHVPDPKKQQRGIGGGKNSHWMDRCAYMGEALYGDPVFSYEGHHYQIIGGNWAQITWRQAEMDAWGRCFGGVPGYLATVDDAAENAFLLGKMLSHQGFASGNAAWIGANDMTNEGSFQWLDGFMGSEVFYRDGAPVNGKYSNFAEGEPDEDGEEDCVTMYSSGQWNDDSCYKRRQFFFVEYDV